MKKKKGPVSEHYRDGGPSTDWYDLYGQWGPGTPCDGDISFYLRHAREVGGPVLELAAGTGRVALEIAGAGFDVVGLDRSPDMLRQARAKARARIARSGSAGSASFVRGDMARFDLGRRFGVIIIAFRSFQHLLTPAAQRSCLLCARRHLRKGGRLLIQLFDPRLDLLLPGRHATGMERAGILDPESGHTLDLVVTGRRSDPLAQTFEETWSWTERDAAGTLVRECSDLLRLRWIYRHEMAYLLELAGFRVRASYSDFKRGRPRYGAEQIWVAERP